VNALMPGEPVSESADRTRASGDRPPAVEVLSAEKVFANGTRALAPIDLSIADGEFLTLIGPSGCGKSTLLTGRSGRAALCVRVPGAHLDAVGPGRCKCAAST